MMQRLASFVGAAGLLVAVPAWAEDGTGAEIVNVAAEEAVATGTISPEQAPTFRAQVHEQMGKQMGDRTPCQGEGGDSRCARLREQVRRCLAEATQHGQLGTQEAADVTAAVLMLAAGEESAEQAGELVRRQLRKGWKGRDMVEAAGAMHRMQERWRKQARQVMQACTGEDDCSGEQARVALRVMEQASRRADLDAREARRTVMLTLREERREGADGAGQGEALRTRLQKRLRVQGRDDGGDALVGDGELKRHQHRRGVDAEIRRGGDFGGGESGGTGAGFASGSPAAGPGSGKGR